MDAHPPSGVPGAAAGSDDDAGPVPSRPGPHLDPQAGDGTETDDAGREATFTAPEGYELL